MRRMRFKWWGLVLLAMALMGLCVRLVFGAGAGTYPVKSTPGTSDTIMITTPDTTKAGGFDIRRVPFSALPVSDPVQAAINSAVAGKADTTSVQTSLNGKQDYHVNLAALAGGSVSGSFVGSGVSATNVTGGILPDNVIPLTVARLAAIASGSIGIDATRFSKNLGSTDNTLQKIAEKMDQLSSGVSSTILADSTDNTKAAAAKTADSLNSSKTSGVPGFVKLPQASGTLTEGVIILGPDTKAGTIGLKLPSGNPTAGSTLLVGTGTNGTLPNGETGVIYPLSYGAGSASNLGVSSFDPSAIVTTSAALTENSTDTKMATWGAILAKMNDILSSGNPSVAITTPLATTWVQSSPYTAMAGTAFDLQGISWLDYKIGAGSYTTTGMSGTTNWTISSIALSEGQNTITVRVTDTDTHTSTATQIIALDTVNPVVNMGSAQTHDGTGKTLTLTSSMFTEANIASVEYWLDSGTHTAWAAPYNNVNVTIPADTANHTISLIVSDLSGRSTTGTLSVTYVANVTPTYSWACLDNAASATVLAQHGGVNGTLINGGNTSDIQSGTGLILPDTALVQVPIPLSIYSSGTFTIKADFKNTRTTGTAWSYLITETSGTNRLTILWDESTHLIRLYSNGTDYGWSTGHTVLLGSGAYQTIWVVFNAGIVTCYTGATGGALTQLHQWTGVTAPASIGASTRFGSNATATSTFKGEISGIAIYNTAVAP